MEKIVLFFVLSLILCFNAPLANTAQVNLPDSRSQSHVVKSVVLSPSVAHNRRSNGPLECYVCNDCLHADQSELKHCPQTGHRGAESKCITYITEYLNGTKKIARNCASVVGTCLDIQRWSSDDPNLKAKTCEECEHDKCNDENSASAVAASLLFILLPTLTAKMFS